MYMTPFQNGVVEVLFEVFPIGEYKEQGTNIHVSQVVSRQCFQQFGKYKCVEPAHNRSIYKMAYMVTKKK
jgi:hypothetical protein